MARTAAAADALKRLKEGGKAALAGALARLEAEPDAPATLELLEATYRAGRAHVAGVTGPPGVGKSTLIGALIRRCRSAEPKRTVGVIAVDPSSKKSGGALLGDRLRLAVDASDPGVFIRSMAARERLGGLSALTYPAMVLMRALYDLVLIETVGVGQSETDVASVADTVIFCVQPGSGDSLQFMKAGIVEIPDIVVVTKADTGAAAARALADVEGALAYGAGSSWHIPVIAASALSGAGLEELEEALARHQDYLAGEERGRSLRARQARDWLKDTVRERFGSDGLTRAGELSLGESEAPFRRLREVLDALGA